MRVCAEPHEEADLRRLGVRTENADVAALLRGCRYPMAFDDSACPPERQAPAMRILIADAVAAEEPGALVPLLLALVERGLWLDDGRSPRLTELLEPPAAPMCVAAPLHDRIHQLTPQAAPQDEPNPLGCSLQ